MLDYKCVFNELYKKGYHLLISEKDYKGVTKTDLICEDNLGYKYMVVYNEIMSGKHPRHVIKSNPFAIYNINKYLENNNLDFECISDKYHDKKAQLDFICKRCGEMISKNWDSINRNGETRTHIQCPNCDGRTESLHAIILKQIFKHEYPSTVEEDKSCINPNTGKIMPTDIVNHDLRIAIEVQSQWHDFPEIKIKDAIKKEFWLSMGYKFYALDIRDYSILDMCKVFFDIDELPSYINYDYKNKLNIKIIQDYLNQGFGVKEISEKLKINPHRIYDALGANKLKYPDNYIPKYYSPVIKYDINGNLLSKYKSIKEAAEKNDIDQKKLSYYLCSKQNMINSCIWKYAKDCD